MPKCPKTAVFLLFALPAAAAAEVREIVVDPLTSAEHWQLGGRRINYVLGASSVSASPEQFCEGFPASLKLTYDFAEPTRDYLSYYHLGEAVPGLCQEVSFRLYGNASGCRLRLSLQDARDRWFERDAGVIDWQGWREVRVPVADGEGWQPLLRRGEERLPVLQPVNLRQIAAFRGAPEQASGSVYAQDLRAVSDLVPADLVSAELTTGRPANLFDLGEAPALRLRLTSRADSAVRGMLSGTVTDFFGQAGQADLGEVELPAGGSLDRELRYPTERLGLHEVEVKLTGGGRERVWFGRFAVVRPREEQPPDPESLFGCCVTLSGFDQEQMPTVLRLNRDAGIRWERLGFGWGEINPAPGRWAWDGPQHIEAPFGRAVELGGQVLSLPHSPVLDCTDAVTLAFWARAAGSNGAWQAVIQKWGPGNRRNYGAYFSLGDGNFCFSAGYEGFPDHGWDDVDSGFSAWDGEWHHYAATYSREDKRVALYVDGQLKAARDWDGGELRTNGDDLVIGSGHTGGLARLALYRRALAPEEVASLAGPGEPPAEGLIAWWPFDDEDGTVRDRSPHRLDLSPSEPQGARIARVGLENGISTLAIIGFPATWASTAPEGADRPWVYKPKLDAWADFVENTTRHYRDVVRHWEIWNEPSISVFWEPKPDPKEFLEVVKTGYEAAKRGNPDCRVLMPGLAGPGQARWGMDFLDRLLELGAARYCDAISIHPYRQTTPEESDLVGDLRHIAELAERNGGRRPIWFTEDCWTTDLPGGSTEKRAALMLPRCYALSLGTGLMERFIWFRLHDPGVDRFYGEDNYGMCYNDLTPKPAYFAHATTAALLEGAAPEGTGTGRGKGAGQAGLAARSTRQYGPSSGVEGEWDVGPRALARVFRGPAGRVAALWAPEGTAPVSVYVGRAQAKLVDLMGNESTVATRDGVLLLEASEAVTFLRDLPEEAEGRGSVLALSVEPLTRGQSGTLRIALRNPFDRAQRARLTLDTPASFSLPSREKEIEVPANDKQELTLDVAVAPDAEPGFHPLRAELAFAGRTFTQTVSVGVRSAAADAGPVGWWKLDEGAGTAIGDSSPSGNHGTVDQPRWVEGKHGKALQFDGQHIAVIPDSPSLNLQDEVTLAFWFRLDKATGSWQFPVGKYLQENVRRNYGIYIHKDTLAPCFSASFEKGGYLHSDAPTTVGIDDGQWHHLAVTYSMFERRVRVYVDGRAAADTPFDEGAMLLTTDPLRFGVGTVGTIDEVRVYPRALTAEEVRGLVG